MKGLVRGYLAAFRGLPRVVWGLAVVTLINRAGTMVHPFLILYLTGPLAYEPMTAALLVGVYGAGSVVGALIGGSLADRIGPVPVLAGSLLLSGLGFLVLGTLAPGPLLILAIFLTPLFGDAFRPAMWAAAMRVTPTADLARGMALLRLAINLGMSIGPAVGGILVTRIGYGLLFTCDGLTAIAAAIALVLVLRPRIPPAPRAESADEAAPALSWSPWRDRTLLVFGALTVVQAILFFQILTAWTFHARNACGFSEDLIGYVLTLNTLLIVLVELPLTARLSTRDPIRLIAVGTFLTGLGWLALPLGNGVAYAALAMVIWTMGEMVAMPYLSVAITAFTPEAGRGRAMGMVTASFGLAGMISAPVSMALYGLLGPTLLWAVSAVAGALAAIGYLRMSPRAPAADGGPGDGVAEGSS